MATITVLAVLVLVTVLVVAIFSHATRETAGARGLAESLRTQWLRDFPVNLVIAQIRAASSEPGSAWATQPGAVWTFGAGDERTIRKLYSAPDMVVGTAAGLHTDLPSNWRAHPERFVDLNRPAIGADGERHFPILDPGILRDSARAPEGFSVAVERIPGGGRGGDELPMPVAWLYVLRDGSVGPLDGSGRVNVRGAGAAAGDNPVVGRIAFWADDECAKVNINTASEGVAWDLPRIAGDETLAKHQPVGREFQRHPGHPAMTSLGAVLFPDARLEPGSADQAPEEAERNALRLAALHAAAPGIRTAGTSQGGTRSVSRQEAAATAATPDPMGAAAPGRHYPTVDDYLFGSGLEGDGTRRLGPVMRPEVGRAPSDLARLRFFLTAHSRAPEVNAFGYPRIALWPVAAPDGAGSGSPPVAGEGLPSPGLSAVDRLMRFCASAGGAEYLFQRAPRNAAGGLPESAADGRNLALLAMLRRLADRPVPGWGKSFAEKYGYGGRPGNDLDQILVQMLDYLREANLVDRGGGGAYADGGSGGAAGGADAERRLEPGHGQVPAWSPVRSAGGGGTAPDPHAPMGFGRFPSISEAVLVLICTGEVVKEGDVLVVKGGGPVDGQDRLKEHWKEIGGKVEEGERRILPALLLEGFCPGQGWTHLIPGVTLTISGGAAGASLEGGVPDLRFRRDGNALLRVPFAGRGANRRAYQDGAVAVTTRITGASPQREDDPSSPISAPWVAWGGAMGPRAFGPAAFSWEEFVLPEGSELAFDGTDEPIRIAVFDATGEGTEAAGAAAAAAPAPTVLAPAQRNQVFEFLFPPFTAPIPENTTEADTQESYWRNSFRGFDGIGSGSRLARAIGPEGPGVLLQSGRDVARSLVPWHNDYRLVANRALVTAEHFVPHPDYASGGLRLVHGLTEPGTASAYGSDAATPHHAYLPDIPTDGDGDGAAAAPGTDAPAPWEGEMVEDRRRPIPGSDFDPASALPWITGDFDNGLGPAPDGPYINRPDDIDTRGMGADDPRVPWFSGLRDLPESNKGFLAPGRLLPSAVQFGSLPSRSRLDVPWVTLLFRPHQGPHPGADDPPDHLLLDLFWMPVVEPWAISEPFSTAGKVNLNHWIVPFTYMRRATALHAVLKAETMVLVPDAGPGADGGPGAPDDPVAFRPRSRIDAGETLRQLDDRFRLDGEIFRSASEICDLWLVPEGGTLGERDRDGRYPEMEEFWSAHRRTGDNTRERPYAGLYPRLTTRSNTFTVHYIVQSIRSNRTTPPGRFDPDADAIAGEIRGAAVIERSVDPNDPTIPDFAGSAPAANLEAYHRFRVVEDRDFVP